MLKIVKNNSEMIVSDEDFRLVYEQAGWKVVSGADVTLPEDTTRRITVEPNTEIVAGPTPLVLETPHEGETIVEDKDENRTRLGKEADERKPKVNGKPNVVKTNQ